MTQIHQPLKKDRILAIAPTTRGIGFAVLDGKGKLGDWGVKSVKGNKNTASLTQVEKLLQHYQPGTLALEDAEAEGSRRAPRVRELSARLQKLAAERYVKTALLSRNQVRRTFFEDGKGAKFELAQILAKRFPEELEHRLPPVRKLWMSEDYRMGIFEAVALALAVHLRRMKRSRRSKGN